MYFLWVDFIFSISSQQSIPLMSPNSCKSHGVLFPKFLYVLIKSWFEVILSKYNTCLIECGDCLNLVKYSQWSVILGFQLEFYSHHTSSVVDSVTASLFLVVAFIDMWISFVIHHGIWSDFADVWISFVTLLEFDPISQCYHCYLGKWCCPLSLSGLMHKA